MPSLKTSIDRIFIIACCLAGFAFSSALKGQTPANSIVTIDGPSAEAIAAAATLSVHPGLDLDIYASEPLIANPVSITFDEKGRCYVVESHRRRTSVYDIRSFPDWLDSDFSFTKVEDRANFLKENLSAGNPSIPKKFIVDRNKDGVFDWRDLEVESERIVLLEDTNQDGKAETSKVFADGFNSIVSGVAAGVLVRGNKVWFTCVPNLWQLKDTNADGYADQRSILHHGFGVHIAFGGHDMHGLIMGPDGRIYFSIADRGSHVEKAGKTLLDLPHTGAVFRCNPDGTKLEVFATGLRNPQELAFDARGNLWTVDNNGDGGDKARLVYLVEGGDSGWRLGWQWLPNMGSWKSEHLWETRETNQGNYLIPPIAYVGHGPAGFAFYPGTGMPEKFKDHFFLADFPGGVRYFKVFPDGAGFGVPHQAEYLEDNKRENMIGKLLWGLSPVDVAFGPEPGVYIADWIQGWDKTGKGRIFRVSASGSDSSESNAINLLLDGGLKDLSIKELGPMLSHSDMRVRQETQFELVGRYEPPTSSVVKVLSGAFNLSALDELTRVVKDRKETLNGRVHALWGLGQLTPKYRDTAETLKNLLSDPEPEIVSQAARVLADRGVVGYYSDYLNLMKHPNLRARFFGVKWLWKTLQSGFQEVQHSEDTKTLVNLRQCGPVFDVLSSNRGHDLYLQHACVMALTQINDLAELVESAGNENTFIRMGAVLALRRMKRQEISVFLRDTDHAIAAEAARAINDVPIEGAQQQLAQLIQRVNLPAAALKRSINAQYRLGNTENAAYLISFAQDKNANEFLRAQAILMLAKWANPPKRDLITGLWRPQEARDPRSAAVPLRLALGKLMSDVPDTVKQACIEAMVALDLQDESDLLLKQVQSPDVSDGVIVDAINALAKFGSPRLIEALSLARSSDSDSVYAAAVRHQSKLKPEDAVQLFEIDLNNDSTLVQQAAIEGLSAIKTPKAILLLDGLMDQLLIGTLRTSLRLDLLEFAAKSEAAVIQQKLKTYRESLPTDDSLAGYRPTLNGGNIKLGEIIFKERQEFGCMRCHSIGNQGGSVGPKLRDSNNSLTREQILESIVDPNRQIAEGFNSVMIDLNDGESMSGVLKSENETQVIILSADGIRHEIPKDQIEDRRSTLSLMPEGLGEIMSKKELRDLIEYLSQP